MKKIIVFDSVHFTIKADKLLQSGKYRYHIITTPREISSDCGMSIETDLENFEDIYNLLKENSLEMKVYEIRTDD
ncbi:MAG: DUF3343 domain-containing protein [Candidatus Cloacimonetes bacterium]|nr:DUF3343 domain-containing protein [Candidatus Cloacimonadota bacterium]